LEDEAVRPLLARYRPQRTMAAMAFATISDVLTNDGTLIAPADMPYQIALAVEKTRRK
jgi:hypothetical protein